MPASQSRGDESARRCCPIVGRGRMANPKSRQLSTYSTNISRRTDAERSLAAPPTHIPETPNLEQGSRSLNIKEGSGCPDRRTSQSGSPPDFISSLKGANAELQGQTLRARFHLNRVIRRRELRQLVPLSDTTIYEMEQRGEFPRRFYLTPRCAAWDLGAVEGWIEDRRRACETHLFRRTPPPDVRRRKNRPVRR
jgi:prophage regulatory protein